LGAFITTVARIARQSFRPLFLSPSPLSSYKPLYDLLCITITITVLNYCAAPFIALTWTDSIRTWGVLGWYGHIVIVGGLVVFYAGGARWLKGLQKSFGVATTPAPSGNGKVDGSGNGNGKASGVTTPVMEKNFVVPPTLDKIVSPPS
jgi:lysophospholipid acyltransferase